MKEKINQRGFSQIYLIIVIIIATILISGSVLYGSGKLDSFFNVPVNSTTIGEQETENTQTTSTESVEELKSLTLPPAEIPEKLGDPNGYVDRLQKLLSLEQKMWQLDIDYADEFISATKQRLIFLNTLYGGTSRILPPTSYINELLLADLDYTQKSQDLFNGYKELAEERTKASEKFYNDLEAFNEEILTKEWLDQFQILSNGITLKFQEASVSFDKMLNYSLSFYDNITLGDQRYKTYFSSAPISYSPPPSLFSNYSYEIGRQTRALEDIATQLRGINTELNYPF